MDNFIVSARKYRPETFSSVVGQNSITATLKNAIKNNHLGHAYLFCGPRGVGKTTCARIFAKTINCSKPTPEMEPCNECESCQSFNESRSYNIHELDAASNNSVEDIRTLTEQVRIPPQLGKYSVYIIDEVHMLSLNAFNAFLKTLEEPPSHAVFILATTEKHKIIPTILSRCQIFDFNRIKIDDTVKFLENIAKAENIAYEAEALHIIAQKADGAMRDALSIFDQVVSFSGKDIVYQSVIDNLNILDYEYYFKMTDFLLQGDVTNCLLKLDEIIRKGFDGHNFINGLASHIRDLLVSKNAETVKLLEVSENFKKLYLEQAAKCSVEFLFEALDICNQTDNQYKASRNQRLLVELALLKMAGNTGLKKKSLKTDEEKNIIHSVLADNKKPIQEPADTETEPQSKQETPIPPVTPVKPQAEKKKEPVHHIVIPDEPKKEEINERHASKNVVPRHNISIKDVMAGKVNPEVEEVNALLPGDEDETEEVGLESNAEEFSPEQLEEKWKIFCEEIKTEKPRMAIALKSKPPVLKAAGLVEVHLENSTLQEDFILNVKAQLQTFLRRELKNDAIHLSVIIADYEDNSKKMVYTAEEKFNYLAGKNPLLNKLKQDFNLEFE
ncbi:MAG: DNA polymerase III subunit gamma/tau [Bacteroidales bacterium]|nr:DNA polymerase III subunit gamma/tau [Bacteroidales bacterium]